MLATTAPTQAAGLTADRPRERQPDLTGYSPDWLLTYLFMAPHPCEALDRLLSGAADA